MKRVSLCLKQNYVTSLEMKTTGGIMFSDIHNKIPDGEEGENIQRT